jgi:hypothetical protein
VEVIPQLGIYAGMPAAVRGFKLASEVFGNGMGIKSPSSPVEPAGQPLVRGSN